MSELTKGGRLDPIMCSYKWTKKEENKAIALQKKYSSIVKVAREMKIPYRSVQVMFQRRGVMPTRTTDVALVSEMCKLYPEAEVCERLNMTETILRNFTEKYGITVYKTRGEMPRASSMPHNTSCRVYATLAGAVAQAQQEQYAVIEVHPYSRGAMINGRRGCYVEFHVLNERHERFTRKGMLELSILDIYVKSPKDERFLMTQEDIEKYSKVINNKTTVIYDDERE